MSLSRRIATMLHLHLRTCTNLHPSPSSLQQTRSKHSATQVKRLFKKNPARLRLLKKKSAERSSPEGTSNDNNGAITTDIPIPSRTYPQVFRPHFLQNGWSAPPTPEFERPNYPFEVKRTGRKSFGAPGFLPVYRDIRIHGTKHTTVIRNVTGDLPAFLTELQSVLQLPPPKKGILNTYKTGGTGSHRPNAARHGGGEAGRGVSSENPIRIRAGGTVEVNGDWRREIKGWLAGLGF